MKNLSNLEPLQTPVLLIIFNNLQTTMQVFAQIRKVKPKKSFISGGWPPKTCGGGGGHCFKKLREIVHQVDWDCDLHTLFSETNSGNKGGCTRAFKWFFEHVEEGIILEDDCVPDVSFFLLHAGRLLERYRNDERILAISGTNFQFGHNRTQHSYYFSRYLLVWGWATWRRVWQRDARSNERSGRRRATRDFCCRFWTKEAESIGPIYSTTPIPERLIRGIASSLYLFWKLKGLAAKTVTITWFLILDFVRMPPIIFTLGISLAIVYQLR